jgi:ParB family chromosome partitioning protein
LADSIRQYGVLQPLVVTRFELEKDDGGLSTEYELIAGERRWRASRLAGLSRVPALIRAPEHSDKVKLELAIIENLQREDLNPIERAEAFHKLVGEFGFKHTEVAKKIGKSREYVSNSLRLLSLPEEIKDAVIAGKITEGHARPLLMLGDRPEEQSVLFKEIHLKRLTVRESEDIARRIAHDKIRKQVHTDLKILGFEKELSDYLGTRVRIEQKAVGGKITIDFFTDEDLHALLSVINAHNDLADSSDRNEHPESGLPEESEKAFGPYQSTEGGITSSEPAEESPVIDVETSGETGEDQIDSAESEIAKDDGGGFLGEGGRVDDPKSSRHEQDARTSDPKSSSQKQDDRTGDDDLYSIQNFSL